MTNRYWHFARCDENGTPRLNYGDNREVRVGETLTVEGEPVMCKRGLHASARLLDALDYCDYQAYLCLVELSGTVLHGEDKSVATERTTIVMLDREQTDALLREFARWCALQVAHLWDMPDALRQYLETGDESLRDAAWDAVEAAAWAAARDAARAAARVAARDAARAAARDAAMDAVEAAAWAAVESLPAAARAAARDAAWDAAWAVALDTQNEWLERRALEMMGVRNE